MDRSPLLASVTPFLESALFRVRMSVRTDDPAPPNEFRGSRSGGCVPSIGVEVEAVLNARGGGLGLGP